MPNILKLGLPAGSLQEATADLFRKAGFAITFASRSYYPAIDDREIQCTLIRSQEMPRYVENGSLDCGLTGHDWIQENEANVVELAELVYSKVSRGPVHWVLAVPNDSSDSRPEGSRRQAHRHGVGRITRRWLKRHGVNAKVEFSWGATEVKPPRLGRRDCRSDRDRPQPAGQQSAHRRRAASDQHAAVYHQRIGIRRSVEEAEDGRPGPHAPRRDGGRGQGGPENERPRATWRKC